MTLVKICGLTDLREARHAAELGAWAIGLIFHAGSPRACDLPAAEEIGAELRRSVLVTGVFVNSTLDEVAAVADRCSLGMLQLHGDEGPAFCREAARRTGCRVMKAARVRDAAAIRALRPFRTDFHLLDAHAAGRRGGTGETFQWELVRAHDRSVPIVLSGGLTADNVGTGISSTRPFAVDTASGTEAAPGRKDPAKVTAFFRAVAAADGRETGNPGRSHGPDRPE
ncbi:MAG TPA: phosphoribosylanthranilate isomerase, partial [Thermoleophilaceae bacterium]|nr:phosphoribosylanthranilate isomerase [Thermoleophilaceae bacterium]